MLDLSSRAEPGRKLLIASTLVTALLGTTGCPDPSSPGLSSAASSAGGAASASTTSATASASASGGASSTGGAGGRGSGGSGVGGSQPSATHAGLVSIQDISIANLPAAGHGLTVTVLFNPATKPDFEETPGAPTGCRGWIYDVNTRPPPPLEDEGTLKIAGLSGGPIACDFDPQRGYICPTAKGAGSITVAAPQGPSAIYAITGGAFSSADVGRYLVASGATTPANNGAFAILGVVSPTEVLVANAKASVETFPASYAVLAGAGPVPGNLYSPYPDGGGITLDVVPGGGHAFDPAEATLIPGGAFGLDDALSTAIKTIPVDGKPLTLGCVDCGEAPLTVVRISTTDADLTGLSPVALPGPKTKEVEIQCALLGATTVTVPAGAMDLLRQAHQASPITRIRTAFMRDAVKVFTNAAPQPANTLLLLAGHAALGFTHP